MRKKAPIGAVFVDLDGVVDDELGGLQGVDLLGVAAEGDHGVAHGGEVDDGGDAGEVLHEHAGRPEGDLAVLDVLGVPGSEGGDVFLRHGDAVLEAHEVLQQDAQGERQARDVGQAGLGESLQTVVGEGAAADVEGRAGAIAIERRHLGLLVSASQVR